ncbi:alpha-methylacyl-CoA racemase-like isoform X2 [Pollicipes pollicipes]|nr:alpha-methylacyl-CoA racemase-like isoform X2 [Pollicipes pollicipes]XP_037080073.1 alpha-methylacyl-CoA racemase-like isoform X2 [Pollicipes pollicipes]XP_037080074.1 alpha-methylacyl-CoA racemase-like isoform X2 [Pollicipes pollicipes]XP_037080075.1 alpha-methylacyl-CoA racemase-like isoform X2 [Pollicipes pollicipes]
MALKGVRVVELAGLAPAPFCGMVLRDFGASIIRVDKMGQPEMDRLARGKRSVSVNLKHKEGAQVVRRLCRGADVLLEPFRPGVMERLGLGPTPLTADNPGLVYARLSGYGQTGPAAGWAGHDINYLAMSGVLSSLAGPDRAPQPPVNILADFAGGGLTCAMGIMAALLERTRSGRGQVIDCSMTEGAAYVSSWLFKSRDLLPIWGEEPGCNWLDGGAFWYGCHRTADDRHMAVGALEPQFFARFADLLGLPDLEQFPIDSAESRRLVAAAFASRSQAEWTAVFAGQDACVTPVLTADEAAASAQAAARASFVPGPRGGAEPAPAPRMSRTPAVGGGDEPRRGQHTTELLLEAGYAAEEVRRLIEDGAVEQCESRSRL